MTQINGQSFPDHVIALTWDDGPDASTLALAEYLRREKVSGTFFVVGEWAEGLSSDPGEGRGVYRTGYERVPILGDLVRLGHRLGNHTLNHVLLTEVASPTAAYELRENQERVDPFLTNELRLFRAPGGAWNEAAAEAVASDPYLSRIVGPVRWDVDRKDWDGSIARVSPSVIAERYVTSIEEARRGIVLLHDRVGRVGSTYALEVARALVPKLKARGYVFAAPILQFSPLTVRAPLESPRARAMIGMADVDGDGRADRCILDERGIRCALSIEDVDGAADGMPRMAFLEPARWGAEWAVGATAVHLADVDGDGLADVCGRVDGEVACARSDGKGFGPAHVWPEHATEPEGSALLFGDLNGDGRADTCGLGPEGVACALSTGQGFAAATIWLRDAEGLSSVALADVNGDGRADLCADSRVGVVCGLAP